jgi:hypothetical protein
MREVLADEGEALPKLRRQLGPDGLDHNNSDTQVPLDDLACAALQGELAR